MGFRLGFALGVGRVETHWPYQYDDLGQTGQSQLDS